MRLPASPQHQWPGTLIRSVFVCLTWLALVFSVALNSTPAFATDPTDDVVGTWNLKLTTPDGRDLTPKFVISREGTGLKGVYQPSEKTDKVPTVTNVTYKSGVLSYVVTVDAIKVTFEGTVADKAIKGTVAYDVNGQTGSFDFAGTFTPEPTKRPAFDEERAESPKGKVQTVEYDSKTTGGKRKLVVYTPPGVAADTKLPVLYLLHGAGDDETGWQVKGNAHVILDNLTAQGKIAPMLVVMPNGFARKEGEETDLRRDFSKLLTNFERDLIDSAIPFVEANFPVKTDRESRAIAGLSMGAAQSLKVGLANLDRFSAIGAFSGANFRGAAGDFVPDVDKARSQLKLFWLSCGEADGAVIDRVRELHTFLEENKVPHLYRIGPGEHVWAVWRNDLFLFSQRLFREKGAVNLNSATPAENLKIAKGFQAELLYSVPKDKEGSWVNMCIDPKGRLIVSDQYGSLYRVTPPALGGETLVEKIPQEIGGAHGLLYFKDSLYVMVNEAVKFGENQPKIGLHRLKSKDGGDTFEAPELLREFQGRGEHGSHAIVPTPDGKSLYIVCGNQAKMTELAASRVPRHWGEDHLLPRMPDGNGFMAGVLGPGGCIYQTDLDGKQWELISTGYRNQFDGAFNRHGDFFTYDADMEWDMNTPWYRPTRICFAASGSEFGWRNGAGKWPAYYPDSAPAVHNIGPGSPTGICFGYGAKFPTRYQDALFICDWSYGKMYAIHMKPNGAAYQGETEEFLAGSPLPLTDVVINPQDGAMYVTVGGRRTQSGLYRVRYVGTEDRRESVAAPLPPLHALRKQLESFHGKRNPQAVEACWPHLNHSDRFVRSAARIALEHQNREDFQDRALSETDPGRSIAALLALVRVAGQDPAHHPVKAGDAIPGAELQGPIISALGRLTSQTLSETNKIDALRVLALTFVRLGPGTPELRKSVADALNPAFPSASRELNTELVNLLVYLEAPGIAGKTLALIEQAPTQEEQMEYARALRVLPRGWTLDERKAFFNWVLKASTFKGGNSLKGFLKRIKDDAVATLTVEEKTQLQALLDAKPPETAPIAGKVRPEVKKWTLNDLTPALAEGLKGRDFERGRRLFGEANCFTCHRFDGEGGAQGPDLTGAGGRFSAKDLLESIIVPSKEVSDQYQAISVELKAGKIVTGRIVNYNNDTMIIMTNMLDPNGLTTVKTGDVESIEKSTTSMMPEGLLNVLDQNEVLDLMAYLLSRGDRKNAMFAPAKP